MTSTSIYDCITETAIKKFKPTFLYIKQHSVTGLLYFGKTTTSDPEKYRGSGKYWKRHIEKHGALIDTLWFCLFTDIEELVKTAILLSKTMVVVKDNTWANLIDENGLCGGDPTGTIRSAETRHRMSKPKSEETRLKMSKPKSEETKRKMSKPKSASHRENMKGRHIVMPEEAKERLSKLNSKFDYLFTCPKGNEYHHHSIKAFAKLHNLSKALLYGNVNLGRIDSATSKQTDGWSVSTVDHSSMSSSSRSAGAPHRGQQFTV